MNYLEQALQRAAALWRAQEKSIEKRLRPMRSAAAGEREEDSPKEDGEAAGTQGARSAGEKLARKLLFAGEASDDAAAPSYALSVPGVPVGAGSAKAESTAVWLREALLQGGTQGIHGGESPVTALMPQREEGGGAEAFSRELERDARRYDGNFLLY